MLFSNNIELLVAAQNKVACGEVCVYGGIEGVIEGRRESEAGMLSSLYIM